MSYSIDAFSLNGQLSACRARDGHADVDAALQELAHFIKIGSWTDFVTVDGNDGSVLVYRTQAEADNDEMGNYMSAVISEEEEEE